MYKSILKFTNSLLIIGDLLYAVVLILGLIKYFDLKKENDALETDLDNDY